MMVMSASMGAGPVRKVMPAKILENVKAERTVAKRLELVETEKGWYGETVATVADDLKIAHMGDR